MLRVHGFVDGGCLRKMGEKLGVPFPDPRKAVSSVLSANSMATLTNYTMRTGPQAKIYRVTYYDAVEDEGTESPDVEDYWSEIELLHDTSLGFGAIRGRRGRRRQKKVDTLLATDMLVGAFTNIFDVAILVSGDADFVPVVDEVRRRGISVVVGIGADGAGELVRACDRAVWFVKEEPQVAVNRLANKTYLQSLNLRSE